MDRPGEISRRRDRADLARLVLAQTIYYGTVSVDLTLTSLAGLALAPSPLLATLPLTLITATGLVASVLVGLGAARHGYRRIMALGALFAIAGGALCAVGVLVGSFSMLCLGTALVGAYRSTGGYIRYLAADLAADGTKERALAIVMYGGLFAAFAGPFAALTASRAFPVEFVGSYLLVAALGMLAIPLVLTISREPVRDARPSAAATVTQARRKPDFTAALVILPLSAALMTLIMAIGPLANVDAQHSSGTGAAMVQWHLVGMFAPAIVSGALLRRWGPWPTTVAGATVTVLGSVIGAASAGAIPMIAAMLFAGVGWNLLFLTGSAFMVRSYATGAGGRLQAIAEGVTGAGSIVGSLGAAVVFNALGWQLSNGPVIVVGLGLLAWAANRWKASARRRPAPAASGDDTVSRQPERC